MAWETGSSNMVCGELPGFHQEGDRNGKRGWSIALGLV
jgi:hypothetical protein